MATTTHLVSSSHSDVGVGQTHAQVSLSPLPPPNHVGLGGNTGQTTVTVTGGNGLPLQLTTITVAVPAQMSPNSAAVLSVPNNVLSVVQQSAGGDNGEIDSETAEELGLTAVQSGDQFKWKYEQARVDKIGTSLVRFIVF